MKVVLKGLFTLLLTVVLVVLIYLNSKLYYHPAFISFAGTPVNADVLQQLHFLKSALRNGAGEQMQAYYPEGFIFINALYGLSWGEVVKTVNNESDLYKEAISEQNWAIQQVYSKAGKRIFDESLPLPYGAFYSGWSGMLVGRKLALQPKSQRDPQQIAVFSATCKGIATALKTSRSPFLESYRGMAWPADMVLCIACLVLYNQLFETNQYQALIATWVAQVKERTDPKTGLIPHQTDAESGKLLEGARGSSQALISCFLNEIDPAFASDQFRGFKAHFLDSRFGLPGIREYPKGVNGGGDIDSGPVILDIGGAASIVGVKSMVIHQEWSIGEGLRNSIEAFGLPVTHTNEKRYVWGKLPMVDAFIAWTNASYPSLASGSKVKNENWRIKFQLFSGIGIACLSLLLLILWKPGFRIV